MLDKNMMILTLGLVLPLTLFAQNENWVYRYADIGVPGAEMALDVVYGTDNFIYASGNPDNRFGVISLTTGGTENWIYKGGWGRANSICYGRDGNLYVAGETYLGPIGTMNLRVASLTTTNPPVERWTYEYNGPFDYFDEGYKIVYGADSNIYVAGYSVGADSSEDFVVVSLTNAGSERWVYRYDGPGTGLVWSDDEAVSLVYGQDGNIYACGYSQDTFYDIVVVSLTPGGTERWFYEYNSSYNRDDQSYSIVDGNDGNLYVAGYTYSTSTASDMLVLSLTTAGGQRWLYTYNAYAEDALNAIIYGADGNLYGTGYSDANGAGYYQDFAVVSLTNGGTHRWLYRYNGSDNNDDLGRSLVYGADNKIYAAGSSINSSSYKDLTAVCLNTSGTQQWTYTYNGPANSADEAYVAVYGPDSNLYMAGATYGTNYDFTVVSLGTGTAVEEVSYSDSVAVIRCAPSVFTRDIQLKIDLPQNVPVNIMLYNSLGRCVYERSYATIDHSLVINDDLIAKLSSGVYFLKVQTGIRELARIKVVKL